MIPMDADRSAQWAIPARNRHMLHLHATFLLLVGEGRAYFETLFLVLLLLVLMLFFLVLLVRAVNGKLVMRIVGSAEPEAHGLDT